VRRHKCLRTSIDAATTHARQPSAPIPVPTAARKLMKVGGERIRATKQMTAPIRQPIAATRFQKAPATFPPLVSAAKPNVGTQSGQCRMPSDRAAKRTAPDRPRALRGGGGRRLASRKEARQLRVNRRAR